MKRTNLNKITLVVIAAMAITLQYCKSPKTVASVANDPAVSYAADIAPLMVRSCSPCHFPENGRKKMLNTLAATRENIDDIMTRVQVPVNDIRYMPFKEKRQALSNEEISVFKSWIRQGMPE